MTEQYVRYASLAAKLPATFEWVRLSDTINITFSMEIQRAMLAASLRSSQEALAFLGRLQSLENSQEVYKKSKQEQNSKDFERKQPKGRDKGGGSDYRETPRNVRHVRYGYRQRNSGPPYRRNTSVRRRNYQRDGGNKRQAHGLNPKIPEFRPRNMDERQRSEQVNTHTERSKVNNSNQEN